MTDTASVQDLHNHWWWRPGWREGRTFYTWHLTLAAQPDVRRLVAHYQAALADVTGLDPIPAQWLHVTMQGLGFTDEVPQADAHAIAHAASELLADIPTPTLVFDRPVIRPEAIAFTPQPASAVHTIRTRIRQAIAQVWGADHVPENPDGYQPHLSLAYVNTPGPATAVRSALDTTTTTPATATITTASLITLERTGHLYRWQPFTTAELKR